MRQRTRLAGVLLAVTAMVIAAGCSSSGGDNTTTSSPPSGPASNSEQAASSGASAGSGASTPSGGDQTSESADAGPSGQPSGSSEGGDRTIKVQLGLQPSSFSPIRSSTQGNEQIMQLQWDALVSLNEKNQIGGRLAESWDISSDAKTITFHLKQGVKWSDGTPFTSKDVVYSFNLYANPKTGSAWAGNFADVVGAKAVADGTATSVTGFSAPDDNTFVIQLSKPNSAYVATITDPMVFIVPEHVVSQLPVDELDQNPFWHDPTVGLGPYVLSQWVNDNEIEFKANPEYATPLGADHLFAQFLTSDAALAQLQTGDIDYAQVSVADMDTVKAMDGVNLVTTQGVSVMALHTALDNGKLADARVRQAVMYGIDRQGIVDQLLKGQGTVINTLVFGPDWAIPDGLNTYPYDPDKAKQLLADANWDPSTEVDINLVPGLKDRDSMVTIVAAQLQAIGMNAKVKEYTPADLGKAVSDRTFDLLPSQYGMFNVDPVTMGARLRCDKQTPNGVNITRYCNEDLDKLLDQGIATPDQSERAQIYAQAQKIVNEEVPIMVLYAPNIIAATSARLHGYKPAGDLSQAFWNAAEWTVD